MRAKNTRDKNRKNRNNNKSNKNQDLEREEAKKGLEVSSNLAKNVKVTRIFLGNLKHLVTNIAEIARKTK